MGQVSATFVKVILNLRDWFFDVEVRPPAQSLSHLDRLNIPADLREFYSLCDGIRIGKDSAGELYSSSRMAERFPVWPQDLHSFDEQFHWRLLPIRDDGCGDYDCLVTGDGPCTGAVIFWDHELLESPGYLLAGSLAAYLRMWSENLLAEWDQTGGVLPAARPPKLKEWPWLGKPALEHPWPFDTKWLRANDPDADRILRDRRQRRWLEQYGKPQRRFGLFPNHPLQWTGAAGVVSKVRTWLWRGPGR
ncbi:MAG TPA: SMI1/KNR4 family protein [Tepidisphaeraceae bacterium]|jgi:hypothetical protein